MKTINNESIFGFINVKMRVYVLTVYSRFVKIQ